MTRAIRLSRGDLGHSAAVVGAVAVATILIGVGVAEDRPLDPGWMAHSLLVALPVGVALALLAAVWSEAALLGLVGLVFGALALTSPLSPPPVLPLGAAAILIVWGARTALFDKGRCSDLVAGALIAWAAGAWIFELAAPFHAL